MRILVFNCGSSSLKYRLIDMPSGAELAGGEAQRVGPKTAEPSRIVHRCGGRERVHVVEMPDHAAAFAEVMAMLPDGGEAGPEAVGHRLVHGGPLFREAATISEKVIADLESIQDLAPLHNPPAIALIKACHQLRPELPQVAVFDTAYHATIPPYASTYALPARLRDEMGFRKYGFHGTSHRFVAGEAARILSKPLDRLNAVSCHLGSGGASLCAIVGGKSVDNTMGYSPLQGLVMSTRCGDIDPAVVLRLMAQTSGDAEAVGTLLNKRSGVLGLSGSSADIRDILTELSPENGWHGQALRTAQTYLWRIRKYLGAYLAVVGRANAVIFTDTIGETVPAVRWSVCTDMAQFGLRIDPERNEQADGLPADIAADESPTRILVIRTNEELAIARQSYEMLADGPGLSERRAS